MLFWANRLDAFKYVPIFIRFDLVCVDWLCQLVYFILDLYSGWFSLKMPYIRSARIGGRSVCKIGLWIGLWCRYHSLSL